jgi:hypothetical protein
MTGGATRPAATFVSYRAATVEGDGGNHRTYQILRDLQAEFGCDGVEHVALEEWAGRSESWQEPTRGALSRLRLLAPRVRQRMSRMTENPYNLLTRDGWSRSRSQKAEFGTRGVLPRVFGDQYVDRVLRRGVSISVVDHPLFDQIRQLNARAGVPTIITSHNLESLDVGRVRFASRVATQRAGVDFANELWSLSQFDARLAISRVEAAVMNGVGLSCEFYPYLPTGEVGARLRTLALERRRREPRPDLFLLMGTAFHAPTRRSLEWFIQHAVREGLPDSARVVVVGSHVDELAPRHHKVPGLEIGGRVSDRELAELLVQAGTALVPQRMGFGALTRIPELACAGVPSLVFPHAGAALDLPPGAHVLDDDRWCTLVEGMRTAMEGHPSTLEPDEYCAWEARQARPLSPTLRQLRSA